MVLMPKIYLDSDMIIATGKEDMPQEEQTALQAVHRAAKAGKCEIYTSQVTAEEIAPYKGERKPAIEDVYEATSKVPFADRQKLLGINSFGDRYTWINSPMIEDNQEWLRIRALGLADKDAHHVMLASHAECNVLLTHDGGLLHRANAIQQTYRVLVMRPTALCNKMNWS